MKLYKTTLQYDRFRLKSAVCEKPSHFGKTLLVPDKSKNNIRMCHKLEKTMNPTIVSKDKKAYAVYNQFHAKKGGIRKAQERIR